MDPDDEAFEAALAGAARSPRRALRPHGPPAGRAGHADRRAQLETVVIGADDALGRPIVGRALVAAGFATSVEDAFRRLIGRGAPAYIPRDGLGPHEAIGAIRAAGGLPVLAHFAEAPGRGPLLRELIDGGLAGLEVFYRTFDRPTVEAMDEVARSLSAPGRPAAATTTATPEPTPRRTPRCGSRPRSPMASTAPAS